MKEKGWPHFKKDDKVDFASADEEGVYVNFDCRYNGISHFKTQLLPNTERPLEHAYLFFITA
jgi:hypothetical protein